MQTINDTIQSFEACFHYTISHGSHNQIESNYMQAWIQLHQTLQYIVIIHIKQMANMYLQQTHFNISLTTTMPSMKSVLQK